jgi:uncharacterized Zn-finger protein
MQQKFIKHANQVHSSKIKLASWIPCQLCSLLFPESGSLAQHQQLDHPPIKCTICTATFLQRELLTTHLKTHFSEILSVANQLTSDQSFSSKIAEDVNLQTRTQEETKTAQELLEPSQLAKSPTETHCNVKEKLDFMSPSVIKGIIGERLTISYWYVN